MQYPVSIAVTWDTSFEQLDAGSRALLHLLSWFAPDPIPVSVWQTPTAEQAIADVAESLRDSDLGRGATELQDAEDARAGLWRYGLIQWTEGRSAFRVHRLVQAVTRERLPEAERTLTLQAALHVLDAYLPADPPPEDVRSWPLWHPVRVHVATLIKRADQHGITQPTGLSERDVDAEILDVHAEASGRRPANGL